MTCHVYTSCAFYSADVHVTHDKRTATHLAWYLQFTLRLDFIQFWHFPSDLRREGLYEIFTALHGMQTRSSDENSVCLSVRPSICPSNAWFVTRWKKVMPAFLYHMKEYLCSFVTKRRKVGGGDPFYLKFWINRPPLERNRRFWTDIRS